MSVIKISDLPVIEAVNTATVLPVVDAGLNRKMSVAQLTSFISGSLTVPRAAIENIVVVPGTVQQAVRSTLYVLVNEDAQTVVTLPANPVAGSIVTISNFTTRSDVLVVHNGKNIMGLDEDFIIDRPNTSVAFCYIITNLAADDTGWIIL
jgi:hypothetical protein